MTPKERILVLCTGNSCRSQMAEGWLCALYADRAVAFSAGAAPADRVHPLAVRVMAEVGVDLSGAKPKHLIEFVGLPFDKVLTTCDTASEACPIFPGRAERYHHDFYDPATASGAEAEQLEVFRHVRDEIRDWIIGIMDSQPGAPAAEDIARRRADTVERAIREAMADGKFDHLAGSGKPFPKEDENPWAEPGSWAANRLLKSAGFSLPWIEERKEIEEQIVSARASLLRSWRYHRDAKPGPLNEKRWHKALATFRERGADINKEIRTYNLKVPVVELQIPVIDVEGEIGQVVDS